MIIISAKEARIAGLLKYFTGKPCPNGHVSERFVSNYGCCLCLASAEEKRKINGYYKLYRNKNSHKIKQWKKDNPEKMLMYSRTTRKNNAARINAYKAKRRAETKKATPLWANHGYINLFYKLAKIEEERTGRKVEVDHIIPLRGKLVSGLHCEDNLQLLFREDNSKKTNTYHCGLEDL